MWLLVKVFTADTSNNVNGHFMSKFSVKNVGIFSKCNFKGLFFCNNMLDHIYVDSMALIQIKYRHDIITTFNSNTEYILNKF